MPEHKVGTREEWQAAREELAKLEAEHAELGRKAKEKRRELPWVPVEKEYVFDTQDGKKTLEELFDGRSQLLGYNIMYGPDYEVGACPGCTSRGSGRGRSGRGPSTDSAATTSTGKRHERHRARAPPGRLAISRRPAWSRCCSHWPHRVGADPPAHGRDGRRAGQRPWRTRLVRRHLGPDDGGDDAPAVAPMVAAYRGRTAGLGATPAFAAGYLIAWLVAGLLGYVLVEGVRSLDLGFLAWDEAGRYLAGSGILGGALYQLTRPQDACLRRCRNARGSLAS